jgi:DNA polymerase I
MANKENLNNDKKLLVLLDSHAIIHRAYHALPDFVSTKGEPTGALYGLSTMLIRIITELKPDYIVATYDMPEKTFRHEAYDAYKAGRVKADESLVTQLISSRNIFSAFNIPMYEKPGFEADDLLGTIVEKTKDNKNLKIIIASGDMDTLQLVSGKRVSVFTLKKGLNDTILYDEQSVIERFGFSPKLLPDYKGLRGDPSDNIIGIAGIGEKTATTLITSFGTIENIFKKLKDDKESFKKIGITDRIIKLLEEGEEEALFSKTLATIRRDAPTDFVLPEKTFHENFDINQVEELFNELEFKSLISRIKKLSGVPDEPKELFPKEEKPLTFEDEQIVQELSIALWLLNSDLSEPGIDEILKYKNSNSLKDARGVILNDIKKNKLDYVYENIELPIIPIVSKMEKTGILLDIVYLKKLSEEYHKSLSILEKKIFDFAGRTFNVNSPKQLGEVLFDELKLQGEGSSANKRIKKTAGGARSTKESELEKLKDSHPIIDYILEYRELQKLLSTYIDTLPLLVGNDGRIHAKFIQNGTTTGRFSSHDPNLQNIPIKSELGKNIRNAFIAKDGYTLVSFDYSQIELRVAALMSQDHYFLKVFEEGKDVHAAVASRVFSVPESEVTSEMRRRAKVINFGILYGMGVNALKANLGTSRQEAQDFYNNYFAQFPEIEGYLNSILELARKTGFTETLFGRRRYFPGLRSKVPFIRAMAERMSINAPLQGTAADIIKIGMKKADDAIISNGLENFVHLVLQVHDELVYEVKTDQVSDLKKVVSEALENVVDSSLLKGKKPVPLKVSSKEGKNWGAF